MATTSYLLGIATSDYVGVGGLLFPERLIIHVFEPIQELKIVRNFLFREAEKYIGYSYLHVS